MQLPLTYGSTEVRVRLERLLAALVLDVPGAHSLVVRGRDEVVSPRVDNQPTHPVVVTHQREQAQSHTDVPHL